MTDSPQDSGYRVTLRDVDKKVDELAKESRKGIEDILARLPDDAHVRFRRLEAAVASQWVVIGIVVVGLGALLARSLTTLF